MKKVIFTLFLLVISPNLALASLKSTAKQAPPATVQEYAIKEVIPGKVYSAVGKAASGETVYFGIELIDETNYKGWRSYFDQTATNARDGMPNLYLSPKRMTPETRPKNNSEITGFSDNEYEEFYTGINEKFSNKFKENIREKMYELKESFMGGAGAMDLDDYSKFPGSYFIAYVSRVPIVGYFPFPKMNTKTLKSYHDSYYNLLMVVRSIDIINTVVYSNRAIFRTLQSFVEGGYRGLSLKLHGITALFFKSYKNKTHMSVAPLELMYKTLKEAAPDLLEGKEIPAQLNHFVGLFGMFDTKCVVPIDSLVKLLK